MRNLDESPLLERPELIEIKSATVDRRRLSEFSLNVYLTQQTAEDGKKPSDPKSVAASVHTDKKP
jgi:type IV pilus assembly protein PilN